jgi:hypothetical protein
MNAPLPQSEIPVVERVARYLARSHADPGQGDALWASHAGDARELLQAIRTPDAIMARVGDSGIWEQMIAAALGEAIEGPVVPERSKVEQPPRAPSRRPVDVEEAGEESFPASDPPAFNPGVA